VKKIIAIGASTSRNSINRQLAAWAASRIPGARSDLLDLNMFEMPIYSADRENGGGIPEAATKFLGEIRGSHGVVISMAEHNGAYTAAFKNIFDWVSRLEYKLWSEKPMFLLSTSPGARGASSVFQMALNTFPRLGADIRASFSLPSFNDNFTIQEGITDTDLAVAFESQLKLYIEALGD
jgi:NAD(P)H-dependent FMN reductase